ncbi:MAG TPA: dihydropteroate synthase [Usitatibacter sp.]|nr:dihydropteroate synthase [Usitatibacter sp.]
MGIVNVTADSFSDGGKYLDASRAIEHGRRLHHEGADLVDVGGESTRPGAAQVDEATELARVIPVVEALAADGIEVSVDTMKPAVMHAAIRAGAAVVNDVNAFRAPGAIEAVAPSEHVRLIVMHMQGTPATMQEDPRYDDVVQEVSSFLMSRVSCLVSVGVARERIALDPGFGFGKTVEHNKQLLRALPQLASHGLPVVAGLSRKKMLGDFTGRAACERAAASVAAALLAVQNGASIVRVHDVKDTVDALKTWMELR